MGRLPWIIWWTQCNHKCFYKKKKKKGVVEVGSSISQRDVKMLRSHCWLWTWRKGPWAKRYRWPLEAWKGSSPLSSHSSSWRPVFQLLSYSLPTTFSRWCISLPWGVPLWCFHYICVDTLCRYINIIKSGLNSSKLWVGGSLPSIIVYLLFWFKNLLQQKDCKRGLSVPYKGCTCTALDLTRDRRSTGCCCSYGRVLFDERRLWEYHGN